MQKRILTMLFVSLFILGAMIAARADGFEGWSPIVHTGYGVTSNYHGMDVPIYHPVVVTAGTTMPDDIITEIHLVWHEPESLGGAVRWIDIIKPPLGPLVTPSTPSDVPDEVTDWANAYTGVTWWYAQGTHSPDLVGDWGVQAIFYDGAGHPAGTIKTYIRSTSFFVIPEVSFGTALMLLSMFGALGVYVMNRKRSIPRLGNM